MSFSIFEKLSIIDESCYCIAFWHSDTNHNNVMLSEATHKLWYDTWGSYSFGEHIVLHDEAFGTNDFSYQSSYLHTHSLDIIFRKQATKMGHYIP